MSFSISLQFQKYSLQCEYNSKIALRSLPPPATAHSHQSFTGIKTLGCFKGHLVWDACLSLGPSQACVTHKSVWRTCSAVSSSPHCVVQGALRGCSCPPGGISVACQAAEGRSSSAVQYFSSCLELSGGLCIARETAGSIHFLPRNIVRQVSGTCTL